MVVDFVEVFHRRGLIEYPLRIEIAECLQHRIEAHLGVESQFEAGHVRERSVGGWTRVVRIFGHLETPRCFASCRQVRISRELHGQSKKCSPLRRCVRTLGVLGCADSLHHGHNMSMGTLLHHERGSEYGIPLVLSELQVGMGKDGSWQGRGGW